MTFLSGDSIANHDLKFTCSYQWFVIHNPVTE